MNKFTAVLTVSALALVLAPLANAETGKTRAQVQAELVAAEQSGDVSVGDSGLTQRDLYPARYEVKTAAAAQVAAPAPLSAAPLAPTPPASKSVEGKTRAEVQAELAAARAKGELSFGDAGFTQRDQFPGLYGSPATRNLANVTPQ